MVLGQKGYHVPKDCQIVGHESAAWRERAITHRAAKRPSIQVPFGMAQKDVAVICPGANDSSTLKKLATQSVQIVADVCTHSKCFSARVKESGN